MLFHLFSFLLTWQLYGIKREISGKSCLVLHQSPLNLWIHSCFFQDFTVPTGYGLINFNMDFEGSTLLCEDSSFLSCSCQSNSLIYSYAEKLILSKLCIYECTSSSLVFSYYKLYPEESIAYNDLCSISNIEGSRILILYQYHINTESLNISHLKNSDVIIYCHSSRQGLIEIAYTSFSNISSIEIFGFATKSYFSICNILQNNADYFMHNHIPCYIRDSCVIENVFNRISDIECYFINCTFNNSISYNESIIFENTPKNSFLHALNFIETAKCKASYDAFDDLLPYTPDKRKRLIPDEKQNIFLL